MYYIINVAALIINCIVNYYGLKKEKISYKEIHSIILLETIGLIVGSKILDLIVNFNNYLNYSLLEIISNGFMFYGGIIYSLLTIIIYCKSKKININRVLEVIIPNILLLYSICKLGCFINHCCIGIHGFPLQLIESVISLCVYITLLKKSSIKRVNYSCIIFGIIRFISIILRKDIYLSNIIVNEIVSLCIIIYGIYMSKNQLS